MHGRSTAGSHLDRRGARVTVTALDRVCAPSIPQSPSSAVRWQSIGEKGLAAPAPFLVGGDRHRALHLTSTDGASRRLEPCFARSWFPSGSRISCDGLSVGGPVVHSMQHRKARSIIVPNVRDRPATSGPWPVHAVLQHPKAQSARYVAQYRISASPLDQDAACSCSCIMGFGVADHTHTRLCNRVQESHWAPEPHAF